MGSNVTAKSDSSVQRRAEAVIVEALAVKIGIPLMSGGVLALGGGVTIQLDARSADGKVAVEAYARQGKLHGGQLKKIAQDILKFALLQQELAHADVRSIVVFASEAAHASITGWVKHAANSFGVELIVVDIDDGLRAELIRAQQRQNMVNA